MTRSIQDRYGLPPDRDAFVQLEPASGDGLVELREVFVSHFHADHYLGLPGMLKTFALRGRELSLTRERIRQIERAALGKLRVRSESAQLRSYLDG